MKIHNADQGSEEWRKLRMGIPTASEFDKILTPGGEPSKQWEGYAHKILAEEMLGRPIEGYKSQAMINGTEREPESVMHYEFHRDIECTKVGFITDDKMQWGCSPDRLIGEEGMLETKNPEPHTHVGYLIDGKINQSYWPQLQGQLFIAERQWVDIMSYYPEMPPKIVRVGRDEVYIKKLAEALFTFSNKLAMKRMKLIALGHLQPKAAA